MLYKSDPAYFCPQNWLAMCNSFIYAHSYLIIIKFNLYTFYSVWLNI